MKRSWCCSRHFSCICRAVKIMSAVPLPDRNPHWLSGMMLLLCTWSLIRARTLPAMDSRETPRWLSHTARSPFRLKMWTTRASLKSCGTISCSQMEVNNFSKWSIRHGPPCLRTSNGISSIPGDFRDEVCLRARWISAADGGSSRLSAVGHCGISDKTCQSNKKRK